MESSRKKPSPQGKAKKHYIVSKFERTANVIVSTPTKYFIAVGHAEGNSDINAFDGALASASIGNINIIKISSILPPECQEVLPVKFPPGALVPSAYGTIASKESNRIISAAVAIAFPEDEKYPGLIMEAGEFGPRQKVEKMVRQMATEGMEMRGKPIRKIISQSIEHRIKRHGAVVAAVVLWN